MLRVVVMRNSCLMSRMVRWRMLVVVSVVMRCWEVLAFWAMHWVWTRRHIEVACTWAHGLVESLELV